DCPGVITPDRLLSAAFLFPLLAVRVLDSPTLRRLDEFVYAQCHRAFLGIAEGDRADAGVQIDVENDEPGLAEVVKSYRPDLVDDLGVVARAPLVLCGEPALVTTLLDQPFLGADDAPLSLALRPEIDAGNSLDLVLQLDALGNHIAVTEPDRLVMRVVF